jgi:hypothetical protein
MSLVDKAKLLSCTRENHIAIIDMLSSSVTNVLR